MLLLKRSLVQRPGSRQWCMLRDRFHLHIRERLNMHLPRELEQRTCLWSQRPLHLWQWHQLHWMGLGLRPHAWLDHSALFSKAMSHVRPGPYVGVALTPFAPVLQGRVVLPQGRRPLCSWASLKQGTCNLVDPNGGPTYRLPNCGACQVTGCQLHVSDLQWLLSASQPMPFGLR